jgi:hypothetical protein
MDAPVNRDQEVLMQLCCSTDLLDARVVARWANLSRQHVYALMSGNHTVPVHVFRSILQHIGGLLTTNPPRFWAIANLVTGLLVDGTIFGLGVYEMPTESRSVPDLCRESGVLLHDMGGLLDTLGHVVEDGQVNPADDPQLEEFYAKRCALTHHLLNIEAQLKAARAASGERKTA